MRKKIIGYTLLQVLVFAGMIPALSGIFSACASSDTANGKSDTSQEQEELYLFEVRSPQELVYNGKRQAISYIFTGEGKPDIVYYASQRDRAEDRRGSRTDPVNAGTYYVRLIRPGKGKAIPAKEFFAVLRILKRPVIIEAEKIQEAIYDGNPKRIQAVVDPVVPLSFSYYPNLELMESAKKSTTETRAGQNTMIQTFRGYRRIDRAPSEQGSYYVWIYYPGDDNYASASMDVEFNILQPKE